jgi:hypothetical protein
LHGSLAAKEDIQAEEGAYRRLQFLNGISEAEERAMATTGRLQFPAEMRSAEEKLEEALHGDRLPDVSELLTRSLAAEEDTGRVNAKERAMATRRSQFAEAMWSADEKLGKTLHGDRLRKVAAKTVINTAVDELARLDKNIRSVQEERMRKVWQEGSLKPGNRRQAAAPAPAPAPASTTSATPPASACASASASDVGVMLYNTCDGAIAAKTRINWCVV